MITNIARRAVGAGRSVVVEEARLYGQAIALFSTFGALAVEAEEDVECVSDIAEADSLEKLLGTFLGEGVAKRADAFLSVVDDAGMFWVVVLKGERAVD